MPQQKNKFEHDFIQFFLKPKETHEYTAVSLMGDSHASRLLLQSLYFEFTQDQIYYEYAQLSIERIIGLIEEGKVNSSAAFCDGLSGFGSLLIYLEHICVIEDNSSDFFNDLDNYLHQQMIEQINSQNWELLFGATGVGLYFFKRSKYHIVEELISSLYLYRTESDMEMKWSRFENFEDLGYIYDLGLAHGNAGIVYFLTKCFAENILREKCLEMIIGLTNFYKNSITRTRFNFRGNWRIHKSDN